MTAPPPMDCPRCASPTLNEVGHPEICFCYRCQQKYRLQDGEWVIEKGRMPEKQAQGRETVSRKRVYSAVQSITFELPLPPLGCSTNNESSRHWRERSEARDQYRRECEMILPPIHSMIFGRMFEKATLYAEFWLAPAVGRYHPRDEQNATASLKALVDSLVEAGYLIDDDAKYLHWGETILRRDHGGRACVTVRLEATK